MSTIKLYRNCRILEEKNFQVDNIETYLSSLVSNTFNNAQYIKQGLDTEVKVVLDQDYLSRETTNNFNYCRIDNGGGSDDYYYYFIRKMVWTAKNCIKLELRLDTLNTFNGCYQLTDKTTINRMHKNRFETYPALSNSIDTFLDDETVWDWGAGAGEIIGKATFQLPDEFISRNFTSTITLIQGTGADLYEIEYDSDFATVTIVAYVQGEESQIPQGQIRIATTSAKVTSNYLTRKVDEVSEGFDAALFGKESEVLTQEMPFYSDANTFTNEDFGTDTWYLTYKTNNNFSADSGEKFIYDNPINCLLTTDKYSYNSITKSDVIITKQDYLTAKASHPQASMDDMLICLPTGASGKKMPNSFPIDFTDAETVAHKISVDILDANDNVVSSFQIGSSYVSETNHRRLNQYALSVYVTNNKWKYGTVKIKRDNYADGTSYKIKEFPTNGKIRFNGIKEVVGYFSKGQIGDVYNWYKLFVTDSAGSSAFYANGQTTLAELQSFKDTDRTDQKLVKIINVPYCPIDISNSSLVYDNTEHQYKLNVDSITKKGNYDPSFTNNIKLNINDYSYSPVSDLRMKKPNLNVYSARNDLYESKLYHSDYFQVKFVYDSFSYIFRNELVDTKEMSDNYNHSYMNVDYCVSNAVASAFGFDFTQYYPLKKQYQDYNVLICNRNNEMPIYNNYYLNYLRSGQLSNDLKNKQGQQVATGIGTGVGIASTVAGIALSATGYGSTFGIPMIVGGVATTATSLTSAITSSVQADRNLQQKLENAKNQSASVRGADDIGLLKWYADNNLCKLMKYELSDATKEKIADLFYYCGYKCDYQAVPNTTSRYWFNFIQCNPVYDESISTAKLNKEMKTDLSEKYQQGVTVLHNHGGNYDFAQNKENWENDLLN